MINWRNIYDEYPEKTGHYLVAETYPFGEPDTCLDVAYYDVKDPGWRVYDENGHPFPLYDVSHWAELPLGPYEEAKAYWITHIYRPKFDHNECSQCHKTNDRQTNFCPNCGAKMIDAKSAMYGVEIDGTRVIPII